MLETSTYVKKISGDNHYIVVWADEKYAKLKCIRFVNREDLGDGIFCTELGQDLTIAQFFSYMFAPA